MPLLETWTRIQRGGDPEEHCGRAGTPTDLMAIITSCEPLVHRHLVSCLCSNSMNGRPWHRTNGKGFYALRLPCPTSTGSHVISACGIRRSLKPTSGLMGPIQKEIRMVSMCAITKPEATVTIEMENKKHTKTQKTWTQLWSHHGILNAPVKGPVTVVFQEATPLPFCLKDKKPWGNRE